MFIVSQKRQRTTGKKEKTFIFPHQKFELFA